MYFPLLNLSSDSKENVTSDLTIRNTSSHGIFICQASALHQSFMFGNEESLQACLSARFNLHDKRESKMNSANKWGSYDDDSTKTQWYNAHSLYENDNSKTQWFNTNKWNDIDIWGSTIDNTISGNHWTNNYNSNNRNQWSNTNDNKVDKKQWYNYNSWESKYDTLKPQDTSYLNSNPQPSKTFSPVSSSYTVENVDIADSYFPQRNSYESSGGPYPNSVSQGFFKPSIEYPYEETIKPTTMSASNTTQKTTNSTSNETINLSNLTKEMENVTETIENSILNNSTNGLDDINSNTNKTNVDSSTTNNSNSNNNTTVKIPQNDFEATTTVSLAPSATTDSSNNRQPSFESQSGNQNIPIQISRNRIEPSEDSNNQEKTNNQLKLTKDNEQKLPTAGVKAQVNTVTIQMQNKVESNEKNLINMKFEKNIKQKLFSGTNENIPKTQDRAIKNSQITMDTITNESNSTRHPVYTSTRKPTEQTSFVSTTETPIERVNEVKGNISRESERINNLLRNETINADIMSNFQSSKMNISKIDSFENLGKYRIPIGENLKDNECIKTNETSHVLKISNETIIHVYNTNAGDEFVFPLRKNDLKNDSLTTSKINSTSKVFEFNTNDEKYFQDTDLEEFKKKDHNYDTTTNNESIASSTADTSVKEFQMKINNFMRKYMMKNKHDKATLIDHKTAIVVPSKEFNYVDIIPISKYKSSINKPNSSNKFGIKQSYSKVHVYPSSSDNMAPLYLNESLEL